MEPRLRLFVPPDERADGYKGPVSSDLQEKRVTVYSWHGKKYDVKGAKLSTLKDAWIEAGARQFKHQWTRKSIFVKKDAAGFLPSEECPPHIDGKAIDASSLLAVDLHGMRKEIREAQRLDPDLSQITAVLETRPAGEFLAAPRGDLHKVRTRLPTTNFQLMVSCCRRRITETYK